MYREKEVVSSELNSGENSKETQSGDLGNQNVALKSESQSYLDIIEIINKQKEDNKNQLNLLIGKIDHQNVEINGLKQIAHKQDVDITELKEDKVKLEEMIKQQDIKIVYQCGEIKDQKEWIMKQEEEISELKIVNMKQDGEIKELKENKFKLEEMIKQQDIKIIYQCGEIKDQEERLRSQNDRIEKLEEKNKFNKKILMIGDLIRLIKEYKIVRMTGLSWVELTQMEKSNIKFKDIKEMILNELMVDLETVIELSHLRNYNAHNMVETTLQQKDFLSKANRKLSSLPKQLSQYQEVINKMLDGMNTLMSKEELIDLKELVRKNKKTCLKNKKNASNTNTNRVKLEDKDSVKLETLKFENQDFSLKMKKDSKQSFDDNVDHFSEAFETLNFNNPNVSFMLKGNPENSNNNKNMKFEIPIALGNSNLKVRLRKKPQVTFETKN